MRPRSGRMALAVLAAAFMTAACAKKLVKKAPGSGAGGDPAEASRRPEPSIRGAEFVSVPELEAVRFGYDRHRLRKEAREILKRNAYAIRLHESWQVLVEGHCDERGTTEYNLALGQKRAKAVRDYYLRLGIGGDRVATISYGEEKPACSELAEDCWARNRRAEHKIKAAPASTASGPKP